MNWKCSFGLHQWKIAATDRTKDESGYETIILFTCENCPKVKTKIIPGNFCMSKETKKLESVQITKEVERILRED